MADAVARSADLVRPAPSRAKTLRWLAIVGALLGLFLGGLYGFNRYREQAIASFFASNKPPPAQIAAVTATSESVPRFATGIGSLAAVHQVTITPEIGGRVTAILFTAGGTVKAGDSLVQLNDAPERGDLANYEAQARYAATTLQRNSHLATNQFASRDTVDQNQSQLDQARAQIAKTQAIIAQKLVRAPFAGRLGVRQIEVGQYLNTGAAIVTLTDLKQLYVNFTLPSTMRAQIVAGQKVNVTADAFPGRVFEATITTLEPQIRADTRTIAAQATLDNPDEALLPGMYMRRGGHLPSPTASCCRKPRWTALYGDSVYVVRETRWPTATDPEGARTPGQNRAALGRQGDGHRGSSRATGWSPPGRSNCRAGPGHRHRQPAAAAASQSDIELIRHRDLHRRRRARGSKLPIVIPAKARTHRSAGETGKWVPAFAGIFLRLGGGCPQHTVVSMKFTDIFIRRPVLALVVSLLILLIGLKAMLGLQIRQYPRLYNTTITVTTTYPGASPDLIQGFIRRRSSRPSPPPSIDYRPRTRSRAPAPTAYIRQLRPEPGADRRVAKVQQVKYLIPSAAQDPVILRRPARQPPSCISGSPAPNCRVRRFPTI